MLAQIEVQWYRPRRHKLALKRFEPVFPLRWIPVPNQARTVTRMDFTARFSVVLYEADKAARTPPGLRWCYRRRVASSKAR